MSGEVSDGAAQMMRTLDIALRSACLALLLAAVPAVAAAGGSPPGIEDFFRPPAMSDAQLSPSGRMLAVLLPAASGRMQLAVVDLDAPAKSRLVAGFDDADVRDFRWVNEKRLVFSAIDLGAGLGEQLAPGLFAVNSDGTGRRNLIQRTAELISRRGSGISGRELSWNHRLHSTLADGSANVIVERFDRNNLMELESTVLLRLDTESGGTTSLLSGQPAGARHWVLDPNGQPRALWTLLKGVGSLYWRNLDGGQWDLLSQDERALTEPTVIPYAVDFDAHLYVLAPDKSDARTLALFRYDVAARKIEERPMVSVEGFDFRGDLVLDRERRRVLGVRFVSDAKGTVWLDPAIRGWQERVDKLLPTTVNWLFCRRCSEARHVLVRSASDRQSPVYWLYDTQKDSLQLLAASRPWIDPAAMATREFTRIKARDGLDLPVYVTRPPVGKGPWPAVVLVHGGPWVRGAEWEWQDDAQFLASRGYLVIQPEFRGSAGFGMRHLRAGFKQWGLAMQDDLADAALWAVKEGIADRQRICIAGASYGGYATLMGLLKHPELYRCGVNWVGVTDIELMYSIFWSDISDETKQFGMPVIVGDPVKDAAQLDATSPLKQAARIGRPILMAYGGQDRRVPIEHGRRFRDAVMKTNSSVEWVEYPDEGHGFLLLRNRVDFWGRVERFLERNLQR